MHYTPGNFRKGTIGFFFFGALTLGGGSFHALYYVHYKGGEKIEVILAEVVSSPFQLFYEIVADFTMGGSNR